MKVLRSRALTCAKCLRKRGLIALRPTGFKGRSDQTQASPLATRAARARQLPHNNEGSADFNQ